MWKMDHCKTVWKIMSQNIRICLTEPRFYIALLLNLFLMEEKMAPIREFSSQIGIGVCPWMFPFLAQHFLLQMVMILGLVFIFCDTPLINSQVGYILIRTGRKKWFFAQVGSVLIITFVYYASLLLISMGLFLSRLKFSLEWGKVLGTLAQTDLASELGTDILDYSLQLKYTPIQAMGRAFLIVWLIGVFTAFLIMVLNVYFKSTVGAIVGTMVAFTPYFAWNASNLRTVQYIAPAIWANIMKSYQIGLKNYPNASYIFGVLIGGSILFIGLAYLRVTKWKLDLSV
jgi:hypothetical protein